MKTLKTETLSDWKELYKFISKNLKEDPSFRIGFFDSLSPSEQESVAFGLRAHLLFISEEFFFSAIDLLEERRAQVGLTPIRENPKRNNVRRDSEVVRDTYYRIPLKRISAIELLDCARRVVSDYGKEKGILCANKKYKLDV